MEAPAGWQQQLAPEITAQEEEKQNNQQKKPEDRFGNLEFEGTGHVHTLRVHTCVDNRICEIPACFQGQRWKKKQRRSAAQQQRKC